MADEDQTLMDRFGGFSRQPAVRQLALLVGLAASVALAIGCLLYTSPSPRDRQKSRMPSSA